MSGRADGGDVEHRCDAEVGATSSSVMVIWSALARHAATVPGRGHIGAGAEQLVGHRALGRSGVASAATPIGADDPVCQRQRHRLGVGAPTASSTSASRWQHRSNNGAGQAAAPAGDQPHRDLAAVADRWRPRASRRRASNSVAPAANASMSTTIAGQTAAAAPPAAGTSSASTSARCNRRTKRRYPCRRPASMASTRDVAPAQQRLADEVGPADDAHRRVVGQRVDQTVGRGIVLRARRPAPPRADTGRARRAPRRTATTADPRSDAARRCAGRRRPDRRDRTPDRAARLPSRGRASAGRHPRPGPRSAAARSDASPRDATATLGAVAAGTLASAAVAGNPSLDIVLTSLGGETRPLEEWLTTFHLASVVLDPYTNESSWILKTAARILESSAAPMRGSTSSSPADADGAKAFLGPLADDFLVFCDPDRALRSQPSAWHSCRRSCSSASTAPCKPAPRVGIPPHGAPSPSRSPRRRRGSARPYRWPATREPSTARRHSLDDGAARRSCRPPRPRSPAGSCRCTRRARIGVAGRSARCRKDDGCAALPDRAAVAVRTRSSCSNRGGSPPAPPRSGWPRCSAPRSADRRIPDTRRAPDRADDPHRGRHRGRVDPTSVPLLDDARSAALESGTPYAFALVEGNRGLLALLCDRVEDAAACFREQLRIAQAHGLITFCDEAFLGLAAVAAHHGRDELAAALQTAGSEQWQTPVAASEQPVYDRVAARYLEPARKRLGAEHWQNAAAAGHGLTEAEAIELARRSGVAQNPPRSVQRLPQEPARRSLIVGGTLAKSRYRISTISYLPDIRVLAWSAAP